MRLQISLSAKIRDLPNLDDEFGSIVEKGAKDYRNERGVWKEVKYTQGMSIRIQRLPSGVYHVYLFDEAKQMFVSVLGLTPRRIKTDRDYVFYDHMAYIHPDYRGKGLFFPLFHWVLNNGIDLTSDEVQSEDNNRVWQKLIKGYRFISVRDGKFNSSETLTKMRDPKRLREDGFITLLFCTAWSDEGVEEFSKNLLAKGHI